MVNFKITAEMREEFVKSMLQMRDEIRSEILDAESAGNRKDARRWISELRKIERAISDYGLERFSTSVTRAKSMKSAVDFE